MAAPPTSKLQPPAIEQPLDDLGNHTQAWAAFHQDVSDEIAKLAKMKQGVTDGSDAAAGDIGEYLSATSSGAVGLTTGTVTNIVSLSLTAGDWDASGNASFTGSGGPYTFFGAGVTSLDSGVATAFPAGSVPELISTATRRFNVTAATTVWLVAQANFSGSVTVNGSIRARRMR